MKPPCSTASSRARGLGGRRKDCCLSTPSEIVRAIADGLGFRSGPDAERQGPFGTGGKSNRLSSRTRVYCLGSIASLIGGEELNMDRVVFAGRGRVGVRGGGVVRVRRHGLKN